MEWNYLNRLKWLNGSRNAYGWSTHSEAETLKIKLWGLIVNIPSWVDNRKKPKNSDLGTSAHETCLFEPSDAIPKR
jgi:hypothetical protein